MIQKIVFVASLVLFLATAAFVTFSSPSATFSAAPAFTTTQGGTGTSSPSGILYGDSTIRLKTVAIGTGLSFSGGTLSSTVSGGSGVGTISTSSALTVGGVVYATSNGYPALVSTTATTTLSASSPLSLSQPINVFGSAASTLTLDTSGTWSGNAGTATALAANGSNCSAGSAAGGVTAGGAAEDCTDYWTEAENTSANYEQALTAGDGLTRTADDFDCDTASGSVSGCLSNTDWTTFNGKLGSYDAWTHPIAGVSATTSILRLAGLNASSTVLFDNATSTKFTATTAWITSLFIGADTLAEYIADTAGAMFTGNTETDITVTYDDADNTVDFVVDTLPNLTGTLDVDSGGTGAATLTGLLQGNGTGAITGSATINNGNWSGTDLSVANGGTGISTFGGTNHILYTTAADTLASEAAFIYAATTNLLTVDSATTTNLTVSQFFKFPTAASNVLNAAGAIAHDTTANQLQWATTTAGVAVIQPWETTGFTYSTSTAWTGTTTISLAPAADLLTFKSVMCDMPAGTLNVSLYDGTNRANLFNASSTVGIVNFTSNNNFTQGEEILLDIGTPATSPTRIACRFQYTYDPR